MKLRRLRLTRRSDRKVYLDRWGIETRYGGVFLHRLGGPDPGVDLHDHPWRFRSIVLRGGYTEKVQRVCQFNRRGDWIGGPVEWRTHLAGSIHTMRLDQAHRIVDVIRERGGTWTLVIFGPRARSWGFYTRDGFVPHHRYQVAQRDLEVRER